METSWAPDDVYFRPEALPAAVWPAGERAGVQMRPRCTLEWLETTDGGPRAVTSQGDVIADAVVVSAGAWGPTSRPGAEAPA